jgi:multidrug efflux pump subunit AcrB
MSGFNLSAFGVRERSLTLFLLIAVAAAGLFAFLKLGRAEDPAFTVKTMVITAVWPGATAQEMQDQVADPLEKRLQELTWYDRVDTTARPGQVTLQLTLKDTTPPAEVAPEWYQVRKKLRDEAVNLPRGVIGPFFNDEFSDVYFALFALDTDGLTPRQLAQEAEALRSRLLRVSGVEKVNILGEQAQRILVEYRTERLTTLGITPQQLLDALSRQNDVTPAGEVDTTGPTVALRLGSSYTSLDAVRLTPVQAGGRTLTIGDIASVRRSTVDPPSYLVRHQGRPALMLGVVMHKGYNGSVLGRDLKVEVDRLRSELPLGISLTQITDQARNIAASYDEFMLKFGVALSVVLIVSLIALGARVGVIVALAVPLTLAGVFVVMLLTDRVFDRITLGALILNLGLLVDDAIIAIEMMVVKLEEGLSRIEAAGFAWGATAAPMLTGTLVTIIGFLPIGFAGSSTGEYAGNLFWVTGFALIISWLVAVYFTPALGVMLLPKIAPVAGGHDAIYGTPRYKRLRSAITYAVDHKRRVAAITVGALVIGAALIAVVPKQFFPTSERPELLVETQLPYGSSIQATTAEVARLEAWLKRQPEAHEIASFVGAGAPRFFLSLNPEPQDPAFAKLVVITGSPAERDTLQTRMRGWVANTPLAGRVRVTSLLFGPPIPYPVTFRVSGPDAAEVRRIAEDVRAEMARNPQALGANLDWGDRAPSLRLAFDADRLAQIGLTPAEAQRQIALLTRGATATQARDLNRTVDVVLRADRADGARLGAIGDLTLVTASGARVPVASVARSVPVFEDPLVRRRDRMPTIAVRADAAPGAQPPDVANAILKSLQPLMSRLPAGCRIETGGSLEESARANTALLPLFPVMVLLMLTVLMVQTRSFRLAGLVFATAPLGVIGAGLGLAVTGAPFGFTSILGLIGLAGILMRNTLILVEQVREERLAGRELHDAIVEATVRRARPVVLTALAAVLAFLPLAFSPFWVGLAVVLIGGTAAGTVLTLLFLPALYALWFGVKPSAEQPLETARPRELAAVAA